MEFSLVDPARGLVALKPFDRRDLAQLSEDELVEALALATRFAKLADVPALKIGAEIARRSRAASGGGMARRRGHQSASGMVAKARGGSSGEAHDAIVTGGLLGGAGDGDGNGDGAGGGAGGGGRDDGCGAGQPGATPRYPGVAAAVEEGALSAAQAACIVQTLDRLDGADEAIERQLVAKARVLSLTDLRRMCRGVEARWNHERTVEREKRQRAERYVTLTEDADGTVRLAGRLDPATAAPLKTWLDAQVKEGFRQRREEGRGPAEPGEAGRLRADALSALARHGLRCDQPGSGVSTEVVVRLTEEALRTGVGLGECDALGTPLSAGTLRRMAVDAAFVPVVLGGESQPLDVGRARRYFSRAQRHALAERDGGCAFCHAPVAWCDAHHLAPWVARRGPTNLSNGVLLCVRCHHRVHDDGWEVRATATEVWFIPPASVDPERAPRRGGRASLHVYAEASGPPR